MARGQADFGAYAVKKVSASISDMGEVAARLGSIVTYDKRGDVVNFDNFEAPFLKSIVLTAPVGDYARLDSASVKSGCQSLKLHLEDGASRGVEYVMACPILASKQIGLEFSFSNKADDVYLMFEINYKAETERFWALGYLHYDGDKLQILDENLAEVDVADLPDLYEKTNFFHTMKLVVDFATAKYVRLLFDQNEYDISAISINEPAVGTPYGIFLYISSNTKVATGGDVWIEDVVITQAEP